MIILPILICVVFLVLLAVRGYRLDRSPLSLHVVVALALGFFFVGRPIYILYKDETSIGSSVDTIALNAALQQGLILASWTCVVFIVTAYVASFYGLTSFKAPTLKGSSVSTLASRNLALFFLVVNVAILVYVIYDAGSLSGYLSNLAVRSRTLRGQSFLTFSYLPLALSTALLFVSIEDARRNPLNALRPFHFEYAVFAVCTVGAVVSAAAGGGRSAVLLTTALPLLVVYDGCRKMTFRQVAAFTATGLVLFIGLSVGLRDSQFTTSDEGVVDMTLESIVDLPTTLWGEQDARPFDSILYLRSPYAADGPLLLGSSYLTTWTFFAPRLLWSNKPFDGGNAVFTRTYNPRFYSGEDRIETSVSIVGEAWMNFRWAGVFVVGFLYGLSLGIVTRVRQLIKGPTSTIVLYAFTAPVLITILRGDAFHNLPIVALVVGLWIILNFVVRERVADNRDIDQAHIGRI